jgi:hypothetical protein
MSYKLLIAIYVRHIQKKKPQLPYQLTDKEISLLEQYPEGLTPLDFKRFQEFCGTQKKSRQNI